MEIVIIICWMDIVMLCHMERVQNRGVEVWIYYENCLKSWNWINAAKYRLFILDVNL